MSRGETRFVTVLGILLVAWALYAWSLYSSFYEIRTGYFYDPSSDRIWRVNLKPTIDPSEKFLKLIPFRSFYFGDIGAASCLGQLHTLLEDAQKGRRHTRDEIESEIEYYLPLREMAVSELLPDKLSQLNRFAVGDTPEVFACDIVVATYSPEKLSPIGLELIRNAIFIRGNAARKLNELGIGYPGEADW